MQVLPFCLSYVSCQLSGQTQDSNLAIFMFPSWPSKVGNDGRGVRNGFCDDSHFDLLL